MPFPHSCSQVDDFYGENRVASIPHPQPSKTTEQLISRTEAGQFEGERTRRPFLTMFSPREGGTLFSPRVASNLRSGLNHAESIWTSGLGLMTWLSSLGAPSRSVARTQDTELGQAPAGTPPRAVRQGMRQNTEPDIAV